MGLSMDFSKLKPHDVLDLAIFAEEEAEEQYEHFATLMETGHNRELAEFFHKMAGREKRHRDQVAERRQALYPNATPNLANRAVWGVEAPYRAKAEPSMPLGEAFKLALDSEKRAQDYYATALQQALEPTVAELFESLRKAEVEHQRLLELERTKRAP
ncbi:MAG TPA: ferritin family protein [Thermoanaerobaculaceae bacterium]|nr:ferritin family protein [Thermoanaerobaculaceae bacterium]